MKYIVLMLLVLAGCAYPTKKDAYRPVAPDKGMAVIYLYRTPTSIHSGNPDVPRFYVNDNLIGKLSIGGYYRILVKPGPVKVTNKSSFLGLPLPWSIGGVEFKAEENKTYFVKYAVDMNPIFIDTIFTAVSNSRGEQEITRTQLLVN